MPTSSIFATLILDDPEGMKILAQKLKEFEEYERPDSEGTHPSPCLTLEEVYELFKDVDVDDIGP